MSAWPPARPASSSSSGYEDGLGRRTLVFDRSEGATFERLTLRPELAAFEPHLQDRAARLLRVEDGRLARPRRIHRAQPGGPLVVDTPLPAGDRLGELVAAASANPDLVAGGVDTAIGFLLEIFPALDALHRQAGCVHGAIGPGRVLVTPTGQVVLLDAIYGDVLAHLGWSRARFWRELGLAIPATAGPPRFTPATDVLHASLTALALLLGRTLHDHEYAGLTAIQAEAVEVAEIHGGGEFAIEFGNFLDRALAPSATGAFISAREAAHQLQQVADVSMGADACRQALRGLTEAVSSAAAVPAPPETASVAQAAAPPKPRVTAVQPPVMELRIEIPAPPPVERPLPAPAPEEIAESAAEAPGTTEPPPAPERPAVSLPPVPDTLVVDAPPQPDNSAAVHDPAAAMGVDSAPALPAPQVDASSPVASEEAVPPVEPPAPAPIAAPPPAAVAAPPPALPESPTEPPPAESPRRRKRGRKRSDGLRSKSSAKPDTAAAAKAPLVTVPPIVNPAPPPPAPPQPVFPAATYGVPTPAPAYGSSASPAVSAYGAPPAPASPYGAPVPPQPSPYGVGGGWQVPMPAALAGDAEQVPMATVQLKPAGTIQLKKAEPSIRPVQRLAPPPEPRVARAPRFELPESAGGGSRWLFAGAAVIVLLVAAVGGRSYLIGDTPPIADPARPEAASSEPAPARGSLILTSTPAGAQVMLDGRPIGRTPLTLDDVAPGRRVVTFTGEGGTVRRTVRVEAGKSAELDVTVFSGWLAVDAPLVLEVALGARVIGTTQQTRLMLPPGRHTVTLRNRDLGYRTTQIVDIEPGEEFKLSLTPTTPVNLNATPWAEVWIDGTRIGETPIARVQMPLGTREIVFRHPELGQRTLTPTVKVGDPAVISVDLTKPSGSSPISQP